MTKTDCAAVILTGGRSRRMGGGFKALEDLHGRPLLGHVIDRLRPQVDTLFLSVESVRESLQAFGLQQLPDPVAGHAGPLGGVLAGLQKAVSSGFDCLLLAPCDAPFIPANLTTQLAECMRSAPNHIAAVRYGGEVQPTFSLWRSCLEPRLQEAVIKGGMAGLKQFFEQESVVLLDWPQQDPPPFFNINDRSALEWARRRLQDQEDERVC